MLRKGFKLNASAVAVLIAGLFMIVLVIGAVRLFYMGPPPKEEAAPEVYPVEAPLGRLPDGVRPLHYVLDFKIIPSETHFSATATLEVEIDFRTPFIWLHGRDLTVSRVQVRKSNGKEVAATYAQVTEGGVARIDFERAIKPGVLMVQLEYEAPFSENLDGLYKVHHDGRDYAFSQFQAIDARRVFPGFDEPRFKAPFDISVIAPEDAVVITNAPEIDLMPVGNGETLHMFASSEPLPPGIVSLAIGPLEVIGGGDLPATDLRNRAVPLRGITVPGKGGQIQPMLDATRPLLEAMETYFGQPYPYAKLDLIAVPEFAWAGMENAGAIHYREDFILIDEETNKVDYINITETHAHELAHQWFGNLVTPSWWDDIWLNESFASWMAGKMVDQWDSSLGADDTVKRSALWVMEQDANPLVEQVHRPVENNNDINNVFSDLAYYKGGGILEMIEAFVGKENFQAGIAMYMKRHKDGTATLDEFIEALSVGSRHPEMDETLRSFLLQPGVPMVEASLDCASSIKRLTLVQSRYYPIGTPALDESFWQIPVCYRTDQGQSCHLLKSKSETVRLGKTCPAFVLPNVEARGYYLWAVDDVSRKKLLSRVSSLSAMETEALVTNLGHWYRSDRISTTDLFRFAEVLIKLKRPRTDDALISVLGDLLRYAPDQATDSAIKNKINALYAARAKDLGLNPRKGEPAGRTLLRERLVPFLAAKRGTRRRLSACKVPCAGPALTSTKDLRTRTRSIVTNKARRFWILAWCRRTASLLML